MGIIYIEQAFIKATDTWYEFVGRDHHKDRDCHWYVSKVKKYSYGDACDEIYFELKHYGYIADDVEFYGETADSVMGQGIEFINQFIKDYNKHYVG